jgi:hypothetical protein
MCAAQPKRIMKTQSRLRHSPLALLLVLLTLAAAAPAAVTPVSYWRGGENDPGAFAGGGCSSATDAVGGRTLQFSPSVFWDSMNVGASAAARVGSTLDLRAYGGESAGTNAAIPSLTNNFGLELWVKPQALTGNQCLAYNGNTGSSGWGLYLIGNQYQGLFGGVGFVGTATATADTWTHLALVRDNGTATLYVNGVAAGSLGGAPVSPAGRFAIMGQPQNPALERLNGWLDEVRVFTFAPGAFSTNDLLLFNSGVVTTKNDAGPGSLRQAITDLNTGGLPGNITFTVTGTITLASDLPASTVPVSVIGPGTNLLTISGSNSFRLFRLAANTTNTISGLTLANGYTANDNSGAALYNLGFTVLQNCALVSNTVVGGFGGAVANFGVGMLIATNCTFANNTVRGGKGDTGAWDTLSGAGGGGAGLGGAVYTEGNTLTISGCSLLNNIAAGGNGGDGGKYSTFGSGTPGANGGWPNRGLGGATHPGGAGGLGGGGGGGGGGSGVQSDGGPGGFGGGGGGGGNVWAGNPFPGGVGGSFGGTGGTGQPILPFPFYNTGGGGGAGLGAGIFARTGAVSIVNCTFTSNLATNGVGGSGDPSGANGQGVGGALFVLDASLNLVNPIFSGNTAATAQPNIGASTLVVNPNDSGNGSLRQAVLIANNDGSATTITFAPALSGQTITLTSGELTLSSTVTIDASSLPAGIILNGGGANRIAHIGVGSSVTMAGLTFTGGNGVGTIFPGVGGAAYVLGALTVSNCTFAANSANNGGGIYAETGSSVTALACTFSSNAVSFAGGGLSSEATVLVKECTFLGNTAAGAGSGGGAVNATAGNVSLVLDGCTITGNSAVNQGGGIRRAGGTVTITNCIVAGNTSGIGGTENLAGTIVITGPNLTTGNPLLAPPGNYGGPTPTMPPLPGSPAIDGCTNGTSFATDQRGLPRIIGAYADIGAVEGTFNPDFPLVNVAQLGSGNVQFAFTNLSGPTYRVLASTNVAAPLNMWSNLGAPIESPPGTFQFTDLQATNYPQRFYRMSMP